jgi:hypothetical protein
VLALITLAAMIFLSFLGALAMIGLFILLSYISFSIKASFRRMISGN